MGLDRQHWSRDIKESPLSSRRDDWERGKKEKEGENDTEQKKRKREEEIDTAVPLLLYCSVWLVVTFFKILWFFFLLNVHIEHYTMVPLNAHQIMWILWMFFAESLFNLTSLTQKELMKERARCAVSVNIFCFVNCLFVVDRACSCLCFERVSRSTSVKNLSPHKSFLKTKQRDMRERKKRTSKRPRGETNRSKSNARGANWQPNRSQHISTMWSNTDNRQEANQQAEK